METEMSNELIALLASISLATLNHQLQVARWCIASSGTILINKGTELTLPACYSILVRILFTTFVIATIQITDKIITCTCGSIVSKNSPDG